MGFVGSFRITLGWVLWSLFLCSACSVQNEGAAERSKQNVYEGVPAFDYPAAVNLSLVVKLSEISTPVGMTVSAGMAIDHDVIVTTANAALAMIASLRSNGHRGPSGFFVASPGVSSKNLQFLQVYYSESVQKFVHGQVIPNISEVYVLKNKKIVYGGEYPSGDFWEHDIAVILIDRKEDILNVKPKDLPRLDTVPPVWVESDHDQLTNQPDYQPVAKGPPRLLPEGYAETCQLYPEPTCGDKHPIERIIKVGAVTHDCATGQPQFSDTPIVSRPLPETTLEKSSNVPFFFTPMQTGQYDTGGALLYIGKGPADDRKPSPDVMTLLGVHQGATLTVSEGTEKFWDSTAPTYPPIIHCAIYNIVKHHRMRTQIKSVGDEGDGRILPHLPQIPAYCDDPKYQADAVFMRAIDYEPK